MSARAVNVAVGPLVTVIVPTKDSERYLEQTLASIRKQNYTNIQLIVVDNFSSDRTREISVSHGAMVVLAGPERSSQLNKGIEMAQGEYVYRVDSDFVLDVDVIAECVALCETGADAVAVFNGSDDANGFWAKVRRFERDMYRGDELIVGARFVRAAMLRDVGGFDVNLVAAEDYDLHNRLVAHGAKITFSSAGEIHLGEPRSLLDVWRKNFYYGTTLMQYAKKYPKRALYQFNPVRGAYLKNLKRFALQPILGAALVLMVITKYTAAAVGAATVLLNARVRRFKRESNA